MAKKYITLEEAAETSGLSIDDLKRLRESGELRGFADRGTWKFREEDLEELRRSRQADSSPDVPLFDEDSFENTSVLDSDEDAVAEQPTDIRNDDVELTLGDSDSDVRLIMDESMVAGEGDSDPEVAVEDSDSDVRLVGEQKTSEDSESDSDVKLVETDSDSDVRLSSDSGIDNSESDVKLIAEGSDSDVQLLSGDDDRSDSDVAVIAASDSGLRIGVPDTDEDQPLLTTDSGISLEKANDSGLALVADDSGITLEDPADSGISLTDDNAYDLLSSDESGISLELEEDAGEAGAGGETVPMLEVPSLDEEIDETQLEIPSLDDDESDFDLVMDDASSGSDANVIFFEEDETDGASATKMRGSAGSTLDSIDDLFDDDDDDFGGELQTLEAEVVDADEDLDIFDAGDEDFEDSFATGESHPGFSQPAPVGRVAAHVEAEWGIPTFVGMILSTALLALCCMVMFDLVRSIWGWSDPSTSSFLLDLLSF